MEEEDARTSSLALWIFVGYMSSFVLGYFTHTPISSIQLICGFYHVRG